MNSLAVTDFSRLISTVTMWQRTEGRPRTENFDRALKAEVRDALWMISKQWQMGEFIGDDAGSPILAKLHMETTRLTKYKGGDGETIALEDDIPLEVKVEHQKVAFQQNDITISLDIRLLMGRQWLKLAAQIKPGLKADFLANTNYQIEAPDPANAQDASYCADSTVWQQFEAVAGRKLDGYKLYQAIIANGVEVVTDGLTLSPQETDDLISAAKQFVKWYRRLYYQPEENHNKSWKPEYLEHQFDTAAPKGGGEKVFTSQEYYHGHLDWYNLDIDQDRNDLGDPSSGTVPTDVEGEITHTFIPTSVKFGGMPHPRWWTFENWRTNLSFVKPDTTDINKLLLMDFFLTYSNDWFMVPFTLPVGSVAKVRGMMVTNVFGEKIWVEGAGKGDDEDWQRWNMYNLAIKETDDVPADISLVLPPISRKVQESKPFEEIYLLRDELANMVWGVETVVPVPSGKGQDGKVTGRNFKDWLQQLIHQVHPPQDDPDLAAKVRYEVVNSVPEHWIPFVPVHLDGQQREVQLQRAAMPRILDQDPDTPKKVEPRTSLMREGLDLNTKAPYFIHEEEITRSGIRVRKSYQRTRWYNGKVFNWIGIKKEIGRGEGNSGLTFDQLH